MISIITCTEIQCVIFIWNTLHDNGVSMWTLQQLICMRHRTRDIRDSYVSPQLLVKEGGRDLLFLTLNDGRSCLYISASKGHLAVVEVSVCRPGV
jgi:hypothetical protein